MHRTDPEPCTRRGAMLPLALSMLLASLGTSIANIALPDIAADLGLPFASVQMAVIAYLAAVTVMVVFAGSMGDRFGHRRMLIAGLGLFAASSALCGAAPSLPVLVGARVAQGVGAAFLTSLSMALVREAAGPDQMGRAMGWLGTLSAVGTALGPSLGGGLVALGGWRWVFLALVPLGIGTLVLGLICLPLAARPPLVLRIGWGNVLTHRLVGSLGANLLVSAVMMATLVVGPFYLALVLGLKPAQVGLVMSVGPMISMASGIPAGRMVDRHGPARAVATGLIVIATGAMSLAVLPGLLGYIGAMLVLTPGYQLFQAANSAGVMGNTDADNRGAVAGLLAFSRNLGLIVGATGLGAVFAAGLGTGDPRTADPAAIADSMQRTFALGAVLALAALLLVRRGPAR